MKLGMWTKLFILAALVGSVVALSRAVSETTTSTSIEGAWVGQLDGLPAVRLTIALKTGNVTGSATFYRILRNPDGSNSHVDGQGDAPLLNTRLQAQTLTFEVRRADGSVAQFRMELKDANHARLFRTNDHPPSPEGAGLELKRLP